LPDLRIGERLENFGVELCNDLFRLPAGARMANPNEEKSGQPDSETVGTSEIALIASLCHAINFSELPRTNAATVPRPGSRPEFACGDVGRAWVRL